MRHSGFSDLAIGEAVGIRVIEGPRGLMAAQIVGWGVAAENGNDDLMPQGSMSNQDQDDFLAHVAE